MRLQGSCHCRNITYTLDWTPEPAEIPARRCTCSFCVKHGGVWTACPTGALEVRIEDRGAVSPYAFGTRTAEFLVCARCGAVPVATSTVGGQTFAVVNVNTLEGLDPARVCEAPVTFDDEDAATRLVRRTRAWIPTVRFVVGGAGTREAS
ncbi:MAG: hypothetical protein JNM61_15035 [Zoogloeaceae bacterium]|nr:hypothetical protein [Zoogloeaceae bacterium]